VTIDTFGYTVKDTDGQVSNEATVTVTIYPVPQVTGILPISGPITTGNPVVITGTGFATATQVYFGTQPAVSFTKTNTTIDAVAPAAPSAAPVSADITVVTSGGTSATSPADVYTWDPVPTLTSVLPAEGVVAGGQTITVDGTGFASGVEGATTIEVRKQGGGESVACTNVQVNVGGTQLTCTTGASTSAGLFDVLVTTPGGATTPIPADQYTYFFAAPSITSVSPSDGPAAGGTSVTITGNSFDGATAVCFGTNCESTGSFTVNSNTSISTTSPAGTAGSRVDITVEGPGGTSSTLPADQFTYGPQVTGLVPSTGPSAGGTTVTISGNGLSGATGVSFGSVAGSVDSSTATSVVATAPPGTGTVNVTVTTPNGVSPVSSSDLFTYSAPVPSVSAVTPNSGSSAGGTAVVINGNGFTGATSVCFGTNCVTPSSVGSGTVYATTPPGTGGVVDVTVTTPGGTSPVSAADKFTYGPYIASLAPVNGPTSGGTTITITGTNLSGATSVSFGSSSVTPVSSTATSITVVTPAATTAGAVNVSAIVGGVATNVKTGGFTYTTSVPTVTSISPTSGPAAGGTTVTVTGSNLTGASAVNFGGTAVTSGIVVNNSGTSLTVNSPAGTAGSTVAVTVVAPGGTSASVANGQFTYGASVSHISPTSGLVTGGTTVTITGTGLGGASAVNFGSTAGTIVTDTATSITVTSPAETAGTVDITVVVGGVASPTSPADQYTFKYPVPSIASMTPNVGVAGNTVTLTGTGFANATTVSFGANPGTILTDTSTSITVTVPSGTAKSVVDVTVTGPGGTSPQTENFTYGPVVTSVSPNEGSHLGGTTVTVKGAGFTGATAVDFGATAGTNVVVAAGGTSLTVKAPAGAAGSVDITVTAGGITSNTGSADSFTYI
jgi:hypothetical protein